MELPAEQILGFADQRIIDMGTQVPGGQQVIQGAAGVKGGIGGAGEKELAKDLVCHGMIPLGCLFQHRYGLLQIPWKCVRAKAESAHDIGGVDVLAPYGLVEPMQAILVLLVQKECRAKLTHGIQIAAPGSLVQIDDLLMGTLQSGIESGDAAIGLDHVGMILRKKAQLQLQKLESIFQLCFVLTQKMGGLDYIDAGLEQHRIAGGKDLPADLQTAQIVLQGRTQVSKAVVDQSQVVVDLGKIRVVFRQLGLANVQSFPEMVQRVPFSPQEIAGRGQVDVGGGQIQMVGGQDLDRKSVV